MHIRQVMTTDPVTVTADVTLRKAAEIMKASNIGMLPIGENDRLVGTLTDRDIVVRGLAVGHGPDTTVREAMTSTLRYCFDDEEVSAVADNIGDEQLRRLPVVDHDKRLVGVVSLGDIAQREDARFAGDTLNDIVKDTGSHD